MGSLNRAAHLPSLTSLRWFAATLVFGHHAAWMLNETRLQDAMRWLTIQGTVGVSFFFMLSGFVLAWSHRSGDTPRAFYRRRFARIAPAYWVACALGVVVAVGWRGDRGLAADAAIVPFTALHAWVPDREVFFAGNPVTWSLSAEVFFYALFPFIVVPIMRLRPRQVAWLLVALGALAVAIPLAAHPSRADMAGRWLIYICPAVRLLEFAIGIGLACLLRAGVRLRVHPGAAAVLALVAYLAAGIVPLYLRPVTVTLIPFALLIFACAQADVAGRRSWLHDPRLVRLGQWSFAFYLVHALIAELWLPVAELSTATWLGLMVLGLTYLSSIAGAYVLFRYVEQPLERRLRDKAAAPRVALA